jgi:hypothetical protein
MLGWTLLIVAAALALVALRYRAPEPRPADAPETEFSGARAREYLRRLIGDGLPHPVGSAQDAVVRGRVMAILKEIGYQPEVQTAFACDEWGTCATVNNVVARLEGSEAGDAVLLSAHYDSVPAGPGASDDGVGCAVILEIARALKALPAPKHAVVILINEGEEAGLLGAHAFVEEHPWAKEIRAAVNIDNRGTSGPSLMFETGSANNWVVKLYARTLDFPHGRPMTSSLYYDAYKELPNDTDFTVFKAFGYQGLNFAFADNVVFYHTPRDNFANADPRSIEHHGENALAALLALADADIAKPPTGDAVFFDVLALWTVHWPTSWTLGAVIAGIVLLAVEVAMLARWKRVKGIEIGFGLLAWFLAVCLAAVASAALLTLLRLVRALPTGWVAHPAPAEIAFWAVAFLAVLLMARTFGSRSNFLGFWAATWIWWMIPAALLAWKEPGISYVFVVSFLLAVLSAAPWVFAAKQKEWMRRVAIMAPGIAACVLGFEVIFGLYTLMGTGLLPGVTIVVAIVLTAFLPVYGESSWTHRGAITALIAISTAVLAIGVIVAAAMPVCSARSPQRVNVEYALDADASDGVWAVSAESQRIPAAMREAASFRSKPERPFPFSFRPVFVANAPALDLEAPALEIREVTESGDKRVYRAVVRSARGAPETMVMFPPQSGVENIAIEGHALPPPKPILVRFLNGWTRTDCATTPAKGIELDFTLPNASPVEAYVADESYELPPEGFLLQKARPEAAVASQDGDVTMVVHKVRIAPDGAAAQK